MLKWLADRVMNAGKNDLIVAWRPANEEHAQYADGTKQLSLDELILTVRPRWESNNFWVTFLIWNGGPKAIGIGAEGTSLLVRRGEESSAVRAIRLTSADVISDDAKKPLPRNCLVDVKRQMNVDAEFGPLIPFDKAVLVIQAKRIFAPQISFQIPYLASEIR